jgi:hypothetical protein
MAENGALCTSFFAPMRQREKRRVVLSAIFFCSRYINKTCPVHSGVAAAKLTLHTVATGSSFPIRSAEFSNGRCTRIIHRRGKNDANMDARTFAHMHMHTSTHQKAGASKTRDWEGMCGPPETCGTPAEAHRGRETTNQPVAVTLRLRGRRSLQGVQKYLT